MAFDGAHLSYTITIRQQPQHARISAMKISDRRPVDPPMIVQLSVSDPRDIGGPNAPPSRTLRPISDQHSHLTNPYYFMYASLVEAHSDNEVKYVNEGGNASTSGALVSSVRVLKDHPNADQDAAFFIFPNICVRLEGSWRFKLNLFVIDGDSVKLCATTYSAPFFVFQGKQYPGVQASSPLARALAAQGVKLRIRNDIRGKNALRQKEEESFGGPDEGLGGGGYFDACENASSGSMICTRLIPLTCRTRFGSLANSLRQHRRTGTPNCYSMILTTGARHWMRRRPSGHTPTGNGSRPAFWRNTNRIYFRRSTRSHTNQRMTTSPGA
ncbi:velvet factor-domain-containing protein [Mycena polygramma]|nr:velvet factor-domain-containing protein [Mycena polygramma]